MTKQLEKYGFSRSAAETVERIIEAIEQNNIAAVEQKIASLALAVSDKVESGILSPGEGDEYFTLLDIWITDHCPDLVLREKVRDILFEGMILHDYGKDYGANLTTLRTLAKEILRRT